MSDRIDVLTEAIIDFAERRNWRQHHTPKNLVMALSVEVGELMEHFMWLDGRCSVPPPLRDDVRAEIGDVMIYLCNLAATLDIDLVEAAQEKLAEAERRYPVTPSSGEFGSMLSKS
ncbi:MAG: nucleotide pyrophosphohydrolase [Cyanobacteria bacterium P01_D01_bin.123]